MKKIVLALVTISLLLTGCSDDGKKESAVSNDSVSPSVEMSASESESTATETVQTASDKAVQPETQNTTEKNSSENQISNTGADTVLPDSGLNISEDTTMSVGELPVIGGEDKTFPENADSKPSVTTTPSSGEKIQTTTTVSASDESHHTVTTIKKSGDVIELPIIPVQ